MSCGQKAITRSSFQSSFEWLWNAQYHWQYVRLCSHFPLFISYAKKYQFHIFESSEYIFRFSYYQFSPCQHTCIGISIDSIWKIFLKCTNNVCSVRIACFIVVFIKFAKWTEASSIMVNWRAKKKSSILHGNFKWNSVYNDGDMQYWDTNSYPVKILKNIFDNPW